MEQPQYIVDAFTDAVFSGNPAAVCPLDDWLPDATMAAIARENNLSETAFIVGARGTEANYQAAARQAYIGLGSALAAAAFEEVDATPMEGFDPEAVDEILGLKARHLRSVILLPLGYRQAEGDWLVNLKKVRRDRNAFVTEVQ